MKPQLQIDPSHYIVPLIGLVNKAWYSLLLFFDKFVEIISKEVAKIKDKFEECEMCLTHLGDEIDILSVNKNMTHAKISNDPSHHKELMSLMNQLNTSMPTK